MLEHYLQRDSPAIKKTPNTYFSTFLPIFWPSDVGEQGQRSSVRRSRDTHTSIMAALELQNTHSKENLMSFRVPVHLPTALLLDLQPVGKLRWWHPWGRGTAQNQKKLPSPLSWSRAGAEAGPCLQGMFSRMCSLTFTAVWLIFTDFTQIMEIDIFHSALNVISSKRS